MPKTSPTLHDLRLRAFAGEFANDRGAAFRAALNDTLTAMGFNAPTAARIVAHSWDEGHSSGCEEVLIYADTMVEDTISILRSYGVEIKPVATQS